MSIATFTLIKNEAPWIAAHILRILPYVDQCVFYDGGSTDGTLEIIKAIISDEAHCFGKIRLVENKDPKDLKDDYVRLFNEALRSVDTDLAYFAHPDFFIVNPERLVEVGKSNAIALTTSMRSFAGEPGGQLYEIKGRQQVWKNIYRLRNPDLGAHYFGHYGAAAEDVYFSAITGNQHIHYGPALNKYPYEVEPSGIEVLHFSDVRPYERRLGRMRSCLINQGYSPYDAEAVALTHPRVTLESGLDRVGNVYEFIPAFYAAEMQSSRLKYQHLERNSLVNA